MRPSECIPNSIGVESVHKSGLIASQSGNDRELFDLDLDLLVVLR